LSYQPEKKFNGSINYQWDQAYTSTQSNYPGEIDAKSLFDVTLGYALSKNLDFELSAINLFNNEFSALPGFPKIGRTVTGRLVFDIE
jgi:outer membrane receptor protein involved in Fe transport